MRSPRQKLGMKVGLKRANAPTTTTKSMDFASPGTEMALQCRSKKHVSRPTRQGELFRKGNEQTPRRPSDQWNWAGDPHDADGHFLHKVTYEKGHPVLAVTLISGFIFLGVGTSFAPSASSRLPLVLERRVGNGNRFRQRCSTT